MQEELVQLATVGPSIQGRDHFGGHGAHQRGKPTAAPRTSPHPARGLKELGGEHVTRIGSFPVIVPAPGHK